MSCFFYNELIFHTKMFCCTCEHTQWSTTRIITTWHNTERTTNTNTSAKYAIKS